MPSVLVTGANSGIGSALVQAFVQRGWRVFGSVRSEAAAEELRQRGVEPVMMDVTDEGSVVKAMGELGRVLGPAGLNLLIPNAGLAAGGPIEVVPLQRWKDVYDVNVFGLVSVLKYALPLLRLGAGHTTPYPQFGAAPEPLSPAGPVDEAAATATAAAVTAAAAGGRTSAAAAGSPPPGAGAPHTAAQGATSAHRMFLPGFLRPKDKKAKPQGEEVGARIVLMGSVTGKMSMPLWGAYASSKHAVEGIADALRGEVAPQGIKVVLLEPGMVDTPMSDKLWEQAEEDLAAAAPEVVGVYRPAFDELEVAKHAPKSTVPLKDVVDAVLHVCTCPKPPIRRVVGKKSSKALTVRKYVSDEMWEALVQREWDDTLKKGRAALRAKEDEGRKQQGPAGHTPYPSATYPTPQQAASRA